MIESVFDLCPDIQEKIGDELKPLVQSKVLKQKSINECHEKMKLGGFLMMEDHVFKKNVRANRLLTDLLIQRRLQKTSN